MDRQIADLVIANGSTTVYEIKTSLDSFARLAAQLAAYTRAFDFVNVVGDRESLAVLTDLVPPHVGLLTLSRGSVLRTVRRAESGKHQVAPAVIYDLLHRAEIVDAVLRTSDVRFDVPAAYLYDAYRPHFVSYTPEVAHALFRDAILRRRRRSAAAVSALKTLCPNVLTGLTAAGRLDVQTLKRLEKRLHAPLYAG